MSGDHRPAGRAPRTSLPVLSAVTVGCAVLLSLGIGWVTTASARSSGLEAAATVRQGSIEQDLWSVIDVGEVAAPLSPASTAELDSVMPTSFGARSSLVWAVLATTDGTPIWTWGEPEDADGRAAGISSPAATLHSTPPSAVARVQYRLPIRPPLSTEPVATFTATVADVDVAVLATGYPVESIAIVVFAVLLAWAAGIALTRWLLRQSWGETETQRRVALIDPLTGLANRSALNERGSAALANAQRQAGHVGLVLIDLNRFKAVNDTGGHALGDRVLVEVARRLLEITRRGELAVRVGGDEFAVLVPGVHRRAELESLAGRVRAALEIPVRFSAAEDVRVTASVGTAWSPVDGDTIADLFKTADTLMYAEKNRVRTPLNASIARAKERARTRSEATTPPAEPESESDSESTRTPDREVAVGGRGLISEIDLEEHDGE